jgi:regulatory protein
MSQARAMALRLLTRRDYSARELRTRLLEREMPEADVTAVIADLSDAGLLNDRRVAESFVRVASTLKGRGRLRISRELEQRGIDRAIIRDALAALPIEDEAASIRRLLERKHLPARLNPAERRRIFGQLVRRGFSADLIATALRGRGNSDEP